VNPGVSRHHQSYYHSTPIVKFSGGVKGSTASAEFPAPFQPRTASRTHTPPSAGWHLTLAGSIVLKPTRCLYPDNTEIWQAQVYKPCLAPTHPSRGGDGDDILAGTNGNDVLVTYAETIPRLRATVMTLLYGGDGDILRWRATSGLCDAGK